jgi:tetratricopeptide (TPR) repeat protein
MNRPQWMKLKSIVAGALEYPRSQRLLWLRALQLSDPEVSAEAHRLIAHAEQFTDTPNRTEAACLEQHEQARSFKVGQKLGNRFRVEGFLGSGGMGEVYAAFDLDADELIALKTLLPEYARQTAFINRLRKELKLAHQLRHPNLCRVHSLHRLSLEEGVEIVALSMELLKGESLAQIVQGKPMELSAVLNLLRQIVAGLQAAHETGILHRDLKSANIFIVEGCGAQKRAVILDFGLAHQLSTSADTKSLFGTNAIVGTAAYMAPEQLRGQGVSTLSDVYSLGVVAFEMVTGRLPFEGETALAIALRRLKQAAPSPRQFRPNLPVRWELSILSCISSSPKQRPPTPQHFLALLEGDGSAIPYWLRRYRRRSMITALGVAGGAALYCYRNVNRAGPHPAAAVESYKRGEVFARRRTPEGIQNAVQEFRRAITLDPHYGEAWASLAATYCAAAHYDLMDPMFARTEAEKAAREALKMNSNLAKPQGALAYAKSVDLLQWRSSEVYFRKAITLDPTDPLPHAWYASFLGRAGRPKEAIEEAQRAVELDPGDFSVNHQLAAEYFRPRRFPNFLSQARELVRIQPSEANAHLSLARAYEWVNSYPQALVQCDEADKFGNHMTVLCFRATIQVSVGNLDSARKAAVLLEDYWRQNPFEANILTNLLAKLAEFERVMVVLNKSYERGDGTVLACATNPYLDVMRPLPDYQAFLRKLGFEPSQLNRSA